MTMRAAMDDTETTVKKGWSMSRRNTLKALGTIGAVGSFAGSASAGSSDGRNTNEGVGFVETNVAEIRSAIIAERMTARNITEQYLDRIEAYDDELNAIITVNSDALDRADELDEKFAESGPVGPLHGVPVILKDNYDTGGLPTTAGSVLLEDSVPPDDAFLVESLREAGGIILAKANLQELAYGRETISSLGGQTHNPYALNRVPGGSSGGPAAAIAANFGVIGMGTDTCASIREPAAYNNLVGIRPTLGLLSRDGIVPLSETQDTGGPMTRTVTDAAIALDTLAGYDSADMATARNVGHIPPEGYTAYLNADGLEDARIGVLREYFGTDEVNAVVETSIQDLEAQSATIIDPISIPNFTDLLTGASVIRLESERDINDYLDTLGEDAPDSLQEIVESGVYTPRIEAALRAAIKVDVESLDENIKYKNRLLRRQAIKEATLSTFAEEDLDAIVYPTSTSVPSVIGEQSEQERGSVRNCTLSAASGFPAITVPAGFTSENKLPVGMELLGGPFDEPRLLELSYSYEQATMYRYPPEGFGPLDE